jgi:hypothetical protein
MIGKLLKSEAWKQSDPDRPGLLLHPRYSSRDSLVGIHRIPVELPHLTKLESRNPVGPEGFRRSFHAQATRRVPIGQETLRPSELCHSPDKATSSYYTKNESFASGISM